MFKFSAVAGLACASIGSLFQDGEEVFQEGEEDQLSLLQLKSNAGGIGVDTHGTNFVCEVFGDPHVKMTFSTTAPGGGRGLQPDFAGPAGVYHLTKSETCNLDMQMYNCPISRKNIRGTKKYGMTMTQGIAIKSGDDLIQVAYEPFDVSQYKGAELVGVTEQEWVEKINQWCPEIDTDAVSREFHEISDNGFRHAVKSVGDPLGVRTDDKNWQSRVAEVKAAFAKDFHLFYRGYLEFNSGKVLPGRCDQTLFGKSLFPVVTVNGVKQPDWDTQCMSLSWWQNSYESQQTRRTWSDRKHCGGDKTREIGNGYIQVQKPGSNLPGRNVIKHPDGLWEIAYLPTAQQAEPIVRTGMNWTHAVATEPNWKYFDPEWELEIFVQPRCFPADAVVPDTICNAPKMDGEKDPVLTYPTTPIPPEESLFDADHQERMCKVCNWNPGEGKARVEWKWTGMDAQDDITPVESPMEGCSMPPPEGPSPPPPPPAEVCEEFGVELAIAQGACAAFQGQSGEMNACIMDFCASGGNPVVPVLDAEGEDTGDEAAAAGDPHLSTSSGHQYDLEKDVLKHGHQRSA